MSYGCAKCGVVIGPHRDMCPERYASRAGDAAQSALRSKPLAEGTIRGAEGVRIAREMMADQGVGWERIPDNDRIAIVQAIMGLCCGAERTGWTFTAPQRLSILTVSANFIIPTQKQVALIAAYCPDAHTLGPYHVRLLHSILNPMLAAMSRLGWTVVAPEERKPIREGGFNRARS